MRAHLASLVEDFRRNSDDIAIVMHRGLRRYATTYAHLAQFTGRFSAELVRRGISPGERIVLWAENSAEWIAVFFGCVLRGVLAVPLDAAGSAAFAQNVIREVTPRLIVADSERGRSLATKLPFLNISDLAHILPPAPDFTIDPAVSGDAPFQIIFTSGTTSEPKGIVHTHRNILANLEPIENEIVKYRRYERLVHPLRFFHTLPFSHVFGQFMGLWIPPILSAEVHLVDVIESHRMVALIRRERVNVLIAVPRILRLVQSHLVASGLIRSDNLGTASALSLWARWWRFRAVHRILGWRFWAIISGGAPLPEDLELFWNRLGFALIQGYGMTETAALITLNHPFRIGHGTIGKALASSSVKLSDTGEILVKGDMVASATWQQGKLRRQPVDWFATGDLAQQSPTGEFRFLGRMGETIVTSSGLKVFPVDLETAMMEQAGVRACAVVPCILASGQEPVCVVIFDGDDADLQQAVVQANRGLAPYQQIRRVLRWPQISFPYTSTGKVLKRAIAEWACPMIRGESPSGNRPPDSLLSLISSLTGEAPPSANDRLRLSEDLHLDSLGRMQLASMLEETTGTPISDATISQAETIGDIRSILDLSALAGPQRRAGPAAPGTDQPEALVRTRPSNSQPVKNRYLHWPWSYPVNLVRILFIEAVVRPLVGLLLAPSVTSPAHLPPGPLLIASNHVSVLDVPLILYALPFRLRSRTTIGMSGELLVDLHSGRKPKVLGKLQGPLAYWLTIALFNVFPLPQSLGFRESFAHAGDALDRSYSVLIFPEGARSTSGQIAPFRGGTGLLAAQAEVPILPLALIGIEQINSGQQRWFRSGVLRVNIGEPVMWRPGRPQTEWTSELETAIRQLHE